MLTVQNDNYESKKSSEIVSYSSSKSSLVSDNFYFHQKSNPYEKSEPSEFWSSVLKYDYTVEDYNSFQIKVFKFFQTFQIDISLVPENILPFAQIKDGIVVFNYIKFFCRNQIVYTISNFIDNFLNIRRPFDLKYFCGWTKCYNQETHHIIEFLCDINFINEKNYYKIYLLQYFIVALNNIPFNKINGFFESEFVYDEQLKNYWIDKAKQIISIFEKS